MRWLVVGGCLLAGLVAADDFSKTEIKQKVEINYERGFVVFKRYRGSDFIGVDSVVAIEEYLAGQLREKNRDLLRLEAKRSQVKREMAYGDRGQGLIQTIEVPMPIKGGLGEFIGDATKLDVGGQEKITIGGRQQFVEGLTGDQPSLIPELEMKQELRINLDGQVGDRLKVFIDHDSQRESESKNKITLTYKGTEDEIVQEIEAGDTQLSIPGTTYTGDIPAHKGLFGIKTTSKAGPVSVVAIASQEKSESQESRYEGKVRTDSTVVFIRDYEGRRFYWIGDTDTVDVLRVWLDDRYESPTERPRFAYAYLDINNDNIPDTTYPSDKHAGRFTLQRVNEFYSFDADANILQLNQPLNDRYVLAIAYCTRSGHIVGDTSTTRDSIQLKLIVPELDEPRSYLWEYERRNIYELGQGIQMTSFKIYYDVPGGQDRDVNDQGQPYRALLGLDPDGNGFVDYPYFNSYNGLLVFPNAYPFWSSQLTAEEQDTIIYRKPQRSLLPAEGRRFYMVVRSVQAAAEYDLPPDVEDGSVKVYVQSILWTEGTDYTVDYVEGKVKFLKPVKENDEVKIIYETTPLFAASQKSLLGMRASMTPFGQTKLGSSIFYRSEGYPEEHARLKSEPHRRVVCEFDVAHPQPLGFLTDAADRLPLVETDAPSNLNLNLETALSFSNPNTKDKVYVDDFERTTITSDFYMPYRSWNAASKPHNKSDGHFARSRLVWYNPPDRMSKGGIFRSPDDPQELAEVLKVYFQPENETTFAGLTQASQFGENLLDCENLEFIVNGKGGKMHIDLATKMSEDQLRRNAAGELVGVGSYQTEDRNNDATWERTIEDTGLDTVFGTDPNQPGDDGNDDYIETDLARRNGTENNGIYDSEDINHDGGFSLDNAYYSYTIDLDSTQFLVGNAELQPGWKMFRIPIKDSANRDTLYSCAAPNWEYIYNCRIWFDGFTAPETVTLYTLSATGSRWQNRGIVARFPPPDDSTELFVLTPVTTRTHTYYRPPYPLLRDEFGRFRAEGGLEFRVHNLQKYHEAVAFRPTDEPEDYREYEQISFLIHTKHSDPQVNFRFGSDTSNYYEYTTYADSGVKGYNDYREITMNLSDFISLKEITKGVGTTARNGYAVRGNPSISAVRFFQIALRNQNDALLSDTIWVNDIRLSAPRREVGRISQGSVGLTWADLATFNFGFSESNGRFKRLSEGKGIGTSGNNQSLSFSSTYSLNKVLPDRWNFSLPFSYSLSRSQSDPRFSYLSEDLELDPGEARRQRSTSRSDRYGLSFSKSGSRHWFPKYAFDNLSLGADLGKSYNKGSTNLDSSRQLSLRGGYRLDPKIGFAIGRERFSLAPQSISFQSGYNDNYATSFSRPNVDSAYRRSTTVRSRLLSPSFSTSYSPHRILNTSYSFAETRDSVSRRRRWGEEVARNQSVSASVSQELFVVAPTLSYRGGYNEDHGFALRRPEDLRNVGNSSDYSASGSFKMSKMLKSLTGLRDESKDTVVLSGSPQWVLMQIEKFSNQVRDPTLNLSRSKTSSYQMIRARPEWRYQFGVQDTVPSELLKNQSLQNRQIRDNLGTSSGLSVAMFNVSFGYNKGITTNLVWGTNNTKTITREYPDLTVTVSQVEKLPFLVRYVSTSSVSSSFNQVIETRGDFKPDSALNITEESRTYEFSPLASWQINWKKGINSSVDVRHSQGYSIRYDAGEFRTNHKTEGVDASLAYSFSAPTGIHLPLLQKIHFKSTLTVNLSAGYSKHLEWIPETYPLTKPSDYSTFTSRLGLSYQFSNSINGGSDVDYSQNKNNNTNINTKIIGVNFWVLFLF